ncbi:MAG: transglutaminase-like domain-containing protein [Phycisphaerales bacterium]
MPTLLQRLVLVLALLASSSRLLAIDDFDRWYALELAGRRAGWMHGWQKTDGDRITTGTRMEIGIGRGPAAVRVKMESEFIETKAGKPLSMKSVQQLGAIPTTTSYTFGDSELSIESTQGEQTTRSTKPLPKDVWLTPAAAGEYVRQRLAAGADMIEVRSIEPTTGSDVITIKRDKLQKVTLEVLGKQHDLVKCISTSSASPGIESTEFIDAQGVPVKTTIPLGGLSMAVTMTTRDDALTATGEAPEVMVKTLVKPDREIAKPRGTKHAVYLLSLPADDGAAAAMPALPTTGAQTVEPVDQAARVRVKADAWSPADPADVANKAFVASSTMINAEDPEIVRLSKEATNGAGDDPVRRAEAIRAFVSRYVTAKDLSVGFATASEVARSRQGDCTEHGALLIALLRADGIPARAASGLIYADQFAGERGVFGYHMWAQALLTIDGKPRWVDLDGTLRGLPFDATHITIAVSALADGEETSSMAALLPLLGRLKIKVEEIE